MRHMTTEAPEQSVPEPNTAAHEEMVAKFGKLLSAASMHICSTMLEKADEVISASPKDPLSAEKYIFVANQLAEIATKMYDLGERARKKEIT